jgi:hypothetical protein
MNDLMNPVVIVRPAEDLAALAMQINREHAAGEEAARRGLEHFRKAGEALLKVKAGCGHGKWLPWLKANVPFSQQTASAYMRLAEGWDKLPAAVNLTLRDALELLADPLPESLDKVKLVLAKEETDGKVVALQIRLFRNPSAGVRLTATGLELLGSPSGREFSWLAWAVLHVTFEAYAHKQVLAQDLPEDWLAVRGFRKWTYQYIDAAKAAEAAQKQAEERDI